MHFVAEKGFFVFLRISFSHYFEYNPVTSGTPKM